MPPLPSPSVGSLGSVFLADFSRSGVLAFSSPSNFHLRAVLGVRSLRIPSQTSGGAVSCLERDFLLAGEKKYRAHKVVFCVVLGFSFGLREGLSVLQGSVKRSFVKWCNSSLLITKFCLG